MLESILRAAGLRALAVGNVGVPLIDAVRRGRAVRRAGRRAVELSAALSLVVAPAAGALLNLAPDHLDWHGSMAAYAQAKARIWAGDVAIGNADDPRVAALLGPPPRARSSSPWPSRPTASSECATVSWSIARFGDDRVALAAGRRHPPGRRAQRRQRAGRGGAGPCLRRRCRGGRRRDCAASSPTRTATSSWPRRGGVDYVDDSKATNPHAAAASLPAYPRIVWIAGGQLKGAPSTTWWPRSPPGWPAAVLLGADRALIAAALARHAPDLPVIEVRQHRR